MEVNALEGFKIVYEGAVAEIVEKKSRFIAYVRPVNTEDEATSFIDEIKKKHWDARHNCSAFVIGKNNELTRCSDDGEPSGTAGKPMLEVLLGQGLHNVAVVVTRYFGGVLLGTGGLVRAYQAAVKEGILASKVLEKFEGAMYKVETDYNGIGKIQYILAKENINTLGVDYSDKVVVEFVVKSDEEGKIVKEITEATAGKAGIERVEELVFGVVDGEVIL
ncbi:MAG: YigZ family protein [Lachnospiraceae bacterium]|nr:YigZ family protein [Lachnospiraceae bacterium]